MNGIVTVAGVAVLLAVMWASGLVHGEQQKSAAEEVILVSAADAEYQAAAPHIARAVLWGDDESGPYGAFTRFDAGADAGSHTHADDVWIVVLDGAYVYRDEAGEKRVGPGHFIRIPGGIEHRSGGDADEGALFYEESSGRFDLVPVN
jgi:mannose-6-phosphate isomerase-like protein (cupin superfamily)